MKFTENSRQHFLLSKSRFYCTQQLVILIFCYSISRTFVLNMPVQAKTKKILSFYCVVLPGFGKVLQFEKKNYSTKTLFVASLIIRVR